MLPKEIEILIEQLPAETKSLFVVVVSYYETKIHKL